jgi:hypothetical protein
MSSYSNELTHADFPIDAMQTSAHTLCLQWLVLFGNVTVMDKKIQHQKKSY